MVDKSLVCVILSVTISDKSIDEEEYTRIRMNREKMAGENFREGRVEVAFELWIEPMTAAEQFWICAKQNQCCSERHFSRLQRSSHRYQGKRYRNPYMIPVL